MSDAYPIIVITSNDYAYLMSEFADRFNRYALEVRDVTCLCYDTIPVLPKNFSVISLGMQPVGKDWTSGLVKYFAELKSDKFMLMLEDYMVCLRIDFDEVDKCANMDCDKFDLTQDRASFPYWISSNNPNLICSDQCARYRSSLQAAIWRTEYFRKFLVPGRTPWEFELAGEIEATRDGARILGTQSGVVHYENAVKMGVRK